MKKYAISAALLLAAVSAPALAAPTLTNTNADGSVVTTPLPGSFTITGGNNGSGEAGNTTYGDAATSPLTITGTFSYLSQDRDGAQYDPAGYFIGAALFQLSNSNGVPSQTGTFSFAVASGSTYGFYVRTTDNTFGPGNITIVSNAFAPAGAVPEPATWAMMLTGFGLVGYGLRRRAGKVATRVAFA